LDLCLYARAQVFVTLGAPRVGENADLEKKGASRFRVMAFVT